MARPKGDGLKIVRKKRADGSVIEYVYDRATNEFLGHDRESAIKRKLAMVSTFAPDDLTEGTLSWLIAKYKGSPGFIKLNRSTQAYYESLFQFMREHFGDLPISMFKRTTIADIRDRLSDTPTKANRLISLFRVIFGYAKDDLEIIDSNPASSPGKLPESPRTQIWTDQEIDTFMSLAPVRLRLAMGLLLHTAQRTSDMLAMRISQISEINGRLYIALRQQKTGQWVNVPVHAVLEPLLRERLNNPPPVEFQRPRGDELLAMVRASSQSAVARKYDVSANAVRKWILTDDLARVSGRKRKDAATIPYIVYSSKGEHWTKRSFSKQWDRVMWMVNFRTARQMFRQGATKNEVKSYLESRQLVRHDLRRTGICKMAEGGATIPQIAAVSGHSVESTTRILDTYLPRRTEIALAAIEAWERMDARKANQHVK